MADGRHEMARGAAAPEQASTDHEHVVVEDTALAGTLDAGVVQTIATAGTTVAECLESQHPSIVGRVLVRVSPPRGSDVEVWVPTLRGLSVRSGDRVLLQRAENWPEAIVTGVIDGFARRPTPEHRCAATLSVLPDEAVRVEASDGTPLVEVFQGEHGPVVRVVEPDVALDLPGELRIHAKRIVLSSEGEVEIQAADDVNVQGETINLN